MDIKLEKDFFLSDVNGASALMDQPSTSSTSLVTQQLLAPSPFFAAVGAGLSAAAVPPSDFDLALGLLPTQQRSEDEPVQSFPPSSSLAPHEPCAVCGDTSDGHHYGVRSCRGCNAFFRRAVTLNLQFTCRRGGRCAVDKNVRCACRACRLQKCVAVGMDKRAVQPKKSVSGMGGGIEGTGSSFDEDHPMGGLTNGGGVGVSGTSRPDDAIVKTEPVIGGSRSAFKPIGAALTTESLMPAVVPSPPTGSGLITRLTFAYKEQLTKRRLMLCRTLDEAILPEGQVQLRGNAEGQDFVELFKVQAVLMFEWCESLEEFRAIKVPLDKTALLRWFVLKYIMLDNIFHTIRIGVTDRLVLVNNVWLSSIPMDPSHRQGEEEPQLTGEQEVQRRLHGEQTMALMEELVKPMAALKFRQGEEVAMRAIAFLNPHTKGLSEETQKIIKQGSERVMNELERYWEETQSISATEARSRLVNLLLLMPSLDKHVLAQKDTLKLIPGFGDTHRWDDYIGDLIRD